LGERKGGNSITPSFIATVRELASIIPLRESEQSNISAVAQLYPFRIPYFYASLMDKGNPFCPIRLQAVPSIRELGARGVPDPLRESAIGLTPSFLKRYPRRGVFLVSSECAMYCRFCNRKRAVGKGNAWEESAEETFRYLEKDREISEVILSGGDPLMLAPAGFAQIVERLRSIKRIEIIRVSTRFPVVFPEGIRPEHLKAMRKRAPMWLIIHINHPKEVTKEFIEVTGILRKAGAVLISQTVLLSRINDCPYVLSELFQRLVRLGIKPYYLFQLDDVEGAQHFKVRVDSGTALVRTLRRDISGLCIPQYAVDVTGGIGKVPLGRDYMVRRQGKDLILRNTAGRKGSYRDDGRQSRCNNCGFCQKNTG